MRRKRAREVPGVLGALPFFLSMARPRHGRLTSLTLMGAGLSLQ